MTVAAISMLKDEIEIAEYTLKRMLNQTDFMVVYDNGSTDGTRDLLSDLSKEWPLTVIDDPEPAYYQSLKMTALGERAYAMGADWLIAADCDECWYSSSGPLKDVLDELPQHFAVADFTVYDHVVTGLDDASVIDPVARIGWRRAEPLPLFKVACRTLPGLTVEAGNHGAHYPGSVMHVGLDAIVHHYPYRSVEQMARKARNGAAAYRAAGDAIPPTTGQHWRDQGRFLEERGIEAIEEIFTTWFYEEDPRETLLLDPCPLPLP